MDILFPYGTIAHWVSSSGFVATIWLGAYIATHVPKRHHARLATLSLFTLSGYFLHVVLCLFLPAEQAGYLWRRYLGWLSLFPLPIWFHLTSSLLPPLQYKKRRIPIRLNYLIGGLLAASWVLGEWSFSRESLLPPELMPIITVFAIIVGGASLYNVTQLRRLAGDATIKRRGNLIGIIILLLMAAILFWPITVDSFQADWSPTVKLAIGDSLPFMATLVLAYGVAFHNMFMSGRWIKQDFFYHAFSIGVFAGLYILTMYATYRFAEYYGFDVPTMVIIAVAGLSVLTHMLSDTSRRIWDKFFVRRVNPIRKDMRSLIGTPSQEENSFFGQMLALVNRLKELTGASTACVAVFEEPSKLLVRASTEPGNMGIEIPLAKSNDGLIPAIGMDDDRKPGQPKSQLLDCLVLAEPIRVNNQVEGYLLLGDRGMSERYDREERLWVSGLAAHLGAAMEKEKQLKETAELIAELKEEAKDLQDLKHDLDQEFEAALVGPLPNINRYELKEVIYAYNKPDKLEEILENDESTLANLACALHSKDPIIKALQKCLDAGLKSLEPPDGLPGLEEIQYRSMNSKKRRHLPSPVANYYTLQLVMTGYTHEDIAEKLDVSARQVRNYLDRSVSLVQTFLEEKAYAEYHKTKNDHPQPTAAI